MTLLDEIIDIRLKLFWLLDDYMIEHEDILEKNGYGEIARFDDAIMPLIKQICKAIGHNMIPDQCGKPEHDYCAYCQYNEEY